MLHAWVASPKPVAWRLLAQGGSEARHSNELLHRIIAEAVEAVAPEVGPGLVGLVSTRDEISGLLKLDDVIDLVRSHLLVPVTWCPYQVWLGSLTEGAACLLVHKAHAHRLHQCALCSPRIATWHVSKASWEPVALALLGRLLAGFLWGILRMLRGNATGVPGCRSSRAAAAPW